MESKKQKKIKSKFVSRSYMCIFLFPLYKLSELLSKIKLFRVIYLKIDRYMEDTLTMRDNYKRIKNIEVL